MKIFDVSTATLLGSIVLASGGAAMSPNSADAAATNAVTAPIWQAMPKMIDQSKQLIKNSLGRGIRYEVVLQKTPDSKAISQLRRALAKKVREVEQASYSPATTKLYLYTFQPGDKVEDALYDAADAAGMPDLNLIYSRGKSFTFDTGL
jgi:enamine deaminase RidA (YjgF/YER057c/UK114 family)